MPPFLDQMRIRNMFSNMFQPQQLDTPVAEPVADMGTNPLFQVSTEARDQLRRMLEDMPRRENFQPTRLRQFAGALANLGSGGPVGLVGGQPVGFKADIKGGLEAQDAVVNRPYNEAVSDWSMRLKPLGELADSEASQNTNARLTGATLLRDQQANASIKQREDAAELRAKTQLEAIAQKDRYLAFKREQELHPDHKYMSDNEGYVYAVNPKTNGITYLTGSDGSRIKESDLPEQEKLRIQHENKLAEIAAAGDEARESIAARGVESRKTKASESSSTSSKVESPTQRKVRLFTKAQEAWNTHPEWRDYIVLNPKGSKGDFELNKPSPGVVSQFLGKKPGDTKVYDEVIKYIYGGEPVISATSSHSSKTITATETKRNRAIKLLNDQNKVVNETTIKAVMDRLED